MANLMVEQLTKEYPTRGEPLRILRGVSLELSQGENLAILGPSGSGKSTLLQIIGTLDTPTSGTVRLNDRDPFGMPERALAQFRSEEIGFVFQDHHLLPQLSVEENVLLPALAMGPPTERAVTRARELITRVGLADRGHHRPAELSGGERQRVAVARALLNQPALVLADEPTGSLDQANAASVGSLLLEMQQQEQAMLIVVTHSESLAELFQCRREIREGRLVDRN